MAECPLQTPTCVDLLIPKALDRNYNNPLTASIPSEQHCRLTLFPSAQCPTPTNVMYVLYCMYFIRIAIRVLFPPTSAVLPCYASLILQYSIVYVLQCEYCPEKRNDLGLLGALRYRCACLLVGACVVFQRYTAASPQDCTVVHPKLWCLRLIY